MASNPKPPTPPEKRAEVLRLHGEGMTRNDIARTVGVSGSTVSKIVAEAGGTFARGGEVKAATEARKTDAAAIRAELELQYAQDAQRLRSQIWQPHKYIDHGGRDYDRVEWTQDEPSPVDKLKLMQASTIAVDRSLKISDSGRGTADLSAVDQWLAHMLGASAPGED